MARQQKEKPSKQDSSSSAVYHPWDIEAKWVEKWEKNPPLAKDLGPKKYYALAEFPYPSGAGLHMGHAFTYSILDPLVRLKRRLGENVLFPIGWDAFGLPTANFAIKNKIHPAIATADNSARFRQQMKRLGLSFNWEREINTTDPNYYKWTQWIFMQLFKYGLAYKKETPVGWCPSCKIILANEEIVGGKCERCGAQAEQRMQKQWLLRITKYADRLVDELDGVDYPDYVKTAQRNWIGRTKGVIIDYPLFDDKGQPIDEYISCYSTRPDTNFGATFVVVAPEHPFVAWLLNSKLKAQNSKRWKEIQKYIDQAKRKTELQRTELQKEKTGVFTGLYCLNRLTNRKMPIWIADFAVATSGTGMVVGVPAHDQRDFDFAKKYGLEIIPVVKPVNCDWDFEKGPFIDIDEATIINSDFLNGLPAKKAIEKIIDYLTQKGWGRRATNYKLRDWIFSRQHYWGEPIPMVYCEECAKKGIGWWQTEEGKAFFNSKSQVLLRFHSGLASTNEILNHKNQTKDRKLKIGISDFIENWKLKIENSDGLAGWFPIPDSELPLKLPEIENITPTEDGRSPLAKATDWVNTKCPVCGSPAKRETDVMPNWAGSSWYYLAYLLTNKLGAQSAEFKAQSEGNKELNIFSENKKLIDYWSPVDIYMGGAEHTTLHLLYSRFWHKFLYDLGLVPTNEPYAARRQHGMLLGEDNEKMSKSRGNVINPEEVSSKFGSDTLRLYLMFMGPYDQTMPWSSKGLEGSWRFLNRVWRLVIDSRFKNNDLRFTDKEEENKLTRKLHQTVKKVTSDITNLKHNTAIASIMDYVNELYTHKQFINHKSIFINHLVLLLAPFTPFIAEELWTNVLGNEFSVHTQPWPEYDEKLIEEDEVEVVVQVNGKLRGALKMNNEKCKMQNEVEREVKKDKNIQKYLEGKQVEKVIFVPGKLINFVV